MPSIILPVSSILGNKKALRMHSKRTTLAIIHPENGLDSFIFIPVPVSAAYHTIRLSLFARAAANKS